MSQKNKIPQPEENLKFIDVHCHLPFPRPKKNDSLPSNDIQFKEYFENGGLYLITSTIDMKTLNLTIKFKEKYRDNYGFTCGWAPQTVTFTSKDIYNKFWEEWKNYILDNQEEYLAIGEIGLDFHHAKSLEKRNRQIEELEKIFNLTRDLNKPYVLHIRNPSNQDHDKNNPDHRYNQDDSATKEILRMINEFKIDPRKVLFHCFSGPKKYSRILVEKGFLLSVPSSAYGFKRWREITNEAPLESLLTETDSYYQHPFKRGPLNVPTNVKYSIAAIAYSHKIDQKIVSKKTIKNAIRFFNLK